MRLNGRGIICKDELPGTRSLELGTGEGLIVLDLGSTRL